MSRDKIEQAGFREARQRALGVDQPAFERHADRVDFDKDDLRPMCAQRRRSSTNPVKVLDGVVAKLASVQELPITVLAVEFVVVLVVVNMG